ncbi:MAG: hypothetical protein ACOYO0_07790, partial [Sandarakinorhabdus sp.]
RVRFASPRQKKERAWQSRNACPGPDPGSKRFGAQERAPPARPTLRESARGTRAGRAAVLLHRNSFQRYAPLCHTS